MKNKLESDSGAALITGSILMVITMALHPYEGSIAHLFKVITMVIITHSIAIISIPIVLFGFWGLTKRLGGDKIISIIAFITICLGMISIMLAAGVNGVAMPLFLTAYKNAPPEIINTLKPILVYSGALNHMFDYIFIGFMCIAVMLWSITIIRTKSLPVWIGYVGMGLFALTIILMLAGFVLVDLMGFRTFIFLFVAWILVVGVQLRKPVQQISIPEKR